MGNGFFAILLSSPCEAYLEIDMGVRICYKAELYGYD